MRDLKVAQVDIANDVDVVHEEGLAVVEEPSRVLKAASRVKKCSLNRNLEAARAEGGEAVFDEAGGMPVLVEKGRALTRRLETELAQALPTEVLEIITPREPASRGQQLSIRTLRGPRGSDLIALLGKKGIVVDFREPDILRVTPVPLYNNENDIHRLVAALKEIHS